MNTKEAIQAMLDGKAVRESHWSKDTFIYFDKEKLIDNNGYGFSDLHMKFSNDWELYGELTKPPVTVTIEKWLMKNGHVFFIVEGCSYYMSRMMEPYYDKVKLIDTYEVEL